MIAINTCLFCEKGCEEAGLHQVLTFDADTNICAMVTELQDTSLLARIVDVGNLIAREAKYHLKCEEFFAFLTSRVTEFALPPSKSIIHDFRYFSVV